MTTTRRAFVLPIAEITTVSRRLVVFLRVYARAGLVRSFDEAYEDLATRWKNWHSRLEKLDSGSGGEGRLYRHSAAVLHTLEAKEFPGAVIASLSVPWGYARRGSGGGAYHLVWTRDLVESIAGLLGQKRLCDPECGARAV